ncbi:hypothetical protein SLEP1_g45326 [Rubroshorea leprosula]|uniref:Uncharacterized protein n=1 Tax=Rubroshorea leprosula TaxID=152421 RepID=A0AAV5LKC7_9ROSI|nr:hypothetical protein SLEP1_g45326 [Rubroshorea leprosula]
MDFFRELRELRGNQGKEEEEGVILTEPIVMIVLLELQDLSEIITPESSANASAYGDSIGHHSAASKDSSSVRTPNEAGDEGEGVSSPYMAPMEAGVPMFVEWKGKTVSRRLSNIRKVPKDLLAGFRFRVALHHEGTHSSLAVGLLDEHRIRHPL